MKHNGTALKILSLRLEKITADPRVQSRAALNEEWLGQLRERLQDGQELHGRDGREYPVVYYDGKTYWLSRGFHRREAHAREGRKTMLVEVRPGDMRAAILDSVESNVYHGVPLTTDDKRHAATMILSDPEWVGWSNREIARRCGVSHVFIGRMRDNLSTGNGFQYPDGMSVDGRKCADGRTMNVEGVALNNILRRLPPELAAKFDQLSHEERVELLASVRDQMAEEASERREKSRIEAAKLGPTDWRKERNLNLKLALSAAKRIKEPTKADRKVLGLVEKALATSKV